MLKPPSKDQFSKSVLTAHYQVTQFMARERKFSSTLKHTEIPFPVNPCKCKNNLSQGERKGYMLCFISIRNGTNSFIRFTQLYNPWNNCYCLVHQLVFCRVHSSLRTNTGVCDLMPSFRHELTLFCVRAFPYARITATNVLCYFSIGMDSTTLVFLKWFSKQSFN